MDLQGLVKTFHPGTENEVRAPPGGGPPGGGGILRGGHRHQRGSGKSTLQNAVSGSFLVDSGSIRLAGRDITRWPEHWSGLPHRPGVPEPLQRHRPLHVRGENRPRRCAGGSGAPWGATPCGAGRPWRIGCGVWAWGWRTGWRTRSGPSPGAAQPGPDAPHGHPAAPGAAAAGRAHRRPGPRAADSVIRLTDDLVREEAHHPMWRDPLHAAQAVGSGGPARCDAPGARGGGPSGEEKRRLRPSDLLDRFDEIKRREQIDASVAEMLRRPTYSRLLPWSPFFRRRRAGAAPRARRTEAVCMERTWPAADSSRKSAPSSRNGRRRCCLPLKVMHLTWRWRRSW